MSTAVEVPPGTAPPARPRRSLTSRPTGADIVFHRVTSTSAIIVLGIMLLVGSFLALRAADALSVAKLDFLTETKWEPDAHHFGIAGVLTGTVLIGLVAILFAVPLATATALYISEYAPARLQRTFITLIDLMAAVPSVVYGLWGFFFLQNQVVPLAQWISERFGWLPFLGIDTEGYVKGSATSQNTVFTSSTFIAGIVVAFMVTPIMCALMREAFSQAPIGEREGAYALGSTKWGMIRTVVLPFGKGGIIGGSMLGLGRALGETIAVYMVLSVVPAFQPNIFQNGGSSVSSLIALRYGEAQEFSLSALFAAGLALFLMTMAINFTASTIVARSRSGAESG
ncbi:phosphate ABC transporter permease subunit PstC [Nocardioides marmoriginsengisoli]|uniref:Phosphate transport system permease protein n=1 Tax=Nocardioides marmoriginsengisoli TaxID=661483 RepID=A0A3N0CIG4_9ACTN|nr:phosphate ABC transporter permease subunit PstC [Nocardioides marmoriginsengisoli]RNL63268.1 phosphate ABC transporter permease subunit PstC [Nocardioides marmoriginsengisoli]